MSELDSSVPETPTKQQELRTFLFLTVLLAPLVAVMLVGGYGFLIWITQIILGPPGPPSA